MPDKIRQRQYNNIKLEGSNIHITDSDSFAEILHKDFRLSGKDFILTDVNTAKYCYPILKNIFPQLDDNKLITIDAGEDEKNISNLHHIWSFLLHAGADRDSRLINLGGGMLTDIGGFAASTYKRGIGFIHIPTSLMGMADAAIGGKTAINLGKVKNQVGLISLPNGVIVYPGFLKTLPWEEFLSGYAEIIKTSLAFDKTFWESLQCISITESQREEITTALAKGILQHTTEIKVSVASKDLTDKSERQCLNFGHSIAHALEALYLSKKKGLLHGVAVAAGMLCEAQISVQIAGLENDEYKRIVHYIQKYFPKISFQEQDIDNIIAWMRHDKKNYDGDIMMSLLSAPGKCIYGIPCPDDILRQSLTDYIHHS
ncbi:MAG: 3-dehydroquinate synthase family protein [Bacteroidota bacterium]